jgi:microcystin-dependent protein
MTRTSLRTALVAGAAAAVLSTTFPIKPAQACPGPDAYLAGVCVFAGTFAPRNWAFTNGQLLSIASNTALFSLVGTLYGGDGRTTFGLPDTRGRAVIGPGRGPGLSNYPVGAKGGQETVTLSTLQMAAHNHTVAPGGISGLGNVDTPSGAVPAQVRRQDYYSTATPDVSMAATTSSATGGSQAHENRPPFLAMNWIIAIQGIYPSRS